MMNPTDFGPSLAFSLVSPWDGGFLLTIWWITMKFDAHIHVP